MGDSTKKTQNNLYNLVDSMGRPSSFYITASNLKEAYKKLKEDKKLYSQFAYGKLKRCYNGGVRG